MRSLPIITVNIDRVSHQTSVYQSPLHNYFEAFKPSDLRKTISTLYLFSTIDRPSHITTHRDPSNSLSANTNATAKQHLQNHNALTNPPPRLRPRNKDVLQRAVPARPLPINTTLTHPLRALLRATDLENGVLVRACHRCAARLAVRCCVGVKEDGDLSQVRAEALISRAQRRKDLKGGYSFSVYRLESC